MDAPHLDNLNPQQRAAACAPLDIPLLIIAGAGTGKTNTLAHRVAHLISTGVNPARILLLTFTRRAAHEMAKRAENAPIQVRRWTFDVRCSMFDVQSAFPPKTPLKSHVRSPAKGIFQGSSKALFRLRSGSS